jgi:V/A-type H+-transporting ATPase subunit E
MPALSGRNAYHKTGFQKRGKGVAVMEVELKNIIEKIKEEGVGEAEKKASGIISAAEAKARSVIEEAENKKKDFLKKATEEAEALKKNGREAVKQASRDAILSLREQITVLFDKIFKREISGAMSTETLQKMIGALASGFRKEGKLDAEVILSDKDKKALEASLLKSLKAEAKKGITIKTSPRVEHGFRIGMKGENSYYDFTDDAVAEAFMTYLNPRIAEILSSGENEQ